MIETRIAKCVMVSATATLSLLVTINNLVDYGSNYAFVQHVLSMDTTFPDNRLVSRAIGMPVLWQVAYLAIIFGEACTGLSLAFGAGTLVRHLRSDSVRFNRSKRWVVIGTTIGFMVWFFGFMVVGGEWFAMWQSKIWNGQQAAVNIYLTMMAVLIFVNQPDPELSLRS